MPQNLANSTLYGKGVFTTIAINDGEAFLWEKHWQRLKDNASRIDLNLGEYSEDFTKNYLTEALSKNKITNGRARITCFDETESAIWSDETKQKTSLSIITGALRPIANNFRLTISPYPLDSRSPLAGIKSCNYLEKIIALGEAKSRAFHEAVQLNERGEITSATMANIFWLQDNTLYTPSLKTGCLPGTTREFILENLNCRETEATLDKLHNAQAIYLTSATLGIIPVTEFESRKLTTIDHPILDLLPKKL
ncbi:MAG: aminotransferase class IV [Chloracidobacterium sp.]|nr:aminotransferase class IV [Chloracidobacterium sp.]